jgi:hypothetical protein
MPKHAVLQTSTGAGELAPELAMRQDTEQYRNGAKSLRNRRCLIGGGNVRRPGSWWLANLPGPARLRRWVVDQTTAYVIAFGDGRMDAYQLDGTPAGGLSGCPWTGHIWREMKFEQSGNTAFVTHPNMREQIITRTGASSWSRADFAFATGPAGRPEQPYLKFAADNVTLQPSGLTGSITLTASANVFEPGHVGHYIRYLKKACLVTGYISPTQVTATVIEKLPETLQLTVASSANFAVDEVVQGATSGAKGQITAIPSGTTINVVITQGLTRFSSETLVGPNDKTTISAVATTTNAAVRDWDEQMSGAVRGRFGTARLHRNRLLLSAHKSAPDYIAGSRINDLYNFNVGTGADAEGFLESIGDAGASRIVDLHSAEQLIVLTDRGPYYVPEGQNNPFRPSSIAFFPFGSPWPISRDVDAVPFDDGVLMVSGSLAIKARPTGDLNRAWSADEVSLLAPHTLKSPIGMAVTSNFAGGPERYAIFVNSDGTFTAMQLVEVQRIRNFTPWDTAGKVESIAAIEDAVFLAVTRPIAGNTVYVLEKLDQALTVDAATQYADLAALDTVPERYGGTPVNVVAGTMHLGAWPLAIDNPPDGPYIVGLNYDSEIELLPPIIETQDGPISGEMMRIYEALVNVKTSARFAANGHVLHAYQVGDDLSQPPPLLDGWQRFQFLGWRRNPTLKITQTDPLPLDVLGIKTKVAYG